MNSDTKEYPTNYPADAVAILDSMSMTDGKGVELVGSMSLRSQQYAGDYDANDFVKLKCESDKEALDQCAKDFKEAIRRTSKTANSYIGDIKCGEVEEWRVFDEDTRVHNGQVVGYNAETSRSKVRALRKNQIITPTEEKEALALLPANPTPIQLVKAKDSIKFNVVRWSVAEVLEGEKRLKDGRTYTLQDGFSSHGITKVDVVAWIQNNRYTEFAMIYFLFNNGKELNPVKFDYEDSLKESILYYASEGMYFKVLKRQFSLAKFKDDKKQMEKLTEILNSDLGRLYHIVSDIRTLVFLLEEQSKLRMSDIKFEIDQFKGRMANIYALDPFLKKEFVFLGYINSALKTSSSKQLLAILKSMDKVMSDILGKSSQKFVGGYRITKTAMEGMFPEGLSGIPSLVSNILTPSYHYLAQRPTLIERSASLGLRQLAEDLLDSYVRLDPTLTERNKEEIEKAKQGHSTAVLRQEERIMNDKPTVKDFYNETLKEAYGKVLKVLDGDKKLAKYFFDYNPDIKTTKKGLESRAVEWALDPANREYWGTKTHPTLDKAKTVSEAEGKEMITNRRKEAVASRLIPALKKKVAETKARKEAEEKAKPKPAPTKKKPKAKKEDKAEEDEDELLRVASELAESEKDAVSERNYREFYKLFEEGAKKLVKENIQDRANDEPADTKKTFDDVRDEGYAQLKDSKLGIRDGTNKVLMDYVGGPKSSKITGFIKEQTAEQRKVMRARLEEMLLETYRDFDTKGMKRVITRYS
jgi:predicted DNA-binding transcriptional regulator